MTAPKGAPKLPGVHRWRTWRRLGVAVALAAVGVSVAAAEGPPWPTRRRPDVRSNRVSAMRVLPQDWPPEPESPQEVDPERLAPALAKLCGWMPKKRRARYGRWVVKYASAFDVDPFLLGAMVHRMGRCRADAEAMSGIGLTLITPSMYYRFIEERSYRYWVRGKGDWQRKSLALSEFPFGSVRLKRPEENLYFAAAFLSAWREQHGSLDEAFDQASHRHYVSHFVWGDRVRSDRSEDRILLDRRRLLQYYGAIERHYPIARRGLLLGSPLDGAPRVISSFIGDPRSGGHRHRGVDLESDLREPVRAIADGMVNFAGVDLPGPQNNDNMSPEEIGQVPRRELGSGGRFVCILHEPDGGKWLRSCYMHLEDVEVRYGQQVERGERIGTVGRTGMKTSAPHLHFELHGPDGLLDPSKVMLGLLIGREVTPDDL